MSHALEIESCHDAKSVVTGGMQRGLLGATSDRVGIVTTLVCQCKKNNHTFLYIMSLHAVKPMDAENNVAHIHKSSFLQQIFCLKSQIILKLFLSN